MVGDEDILVGEPKEDTVPPKEAINQDEFLIDAKEFFEADCKQIGKVAKAG